MVLPVAVSSPTPSYTEAAKNFRLKGTVVLEGIVDTKERVTITNILRPLGMGLDESSVYTVSEWIFNPALLHGKPVDYRIMIEVAFNLY